MQQQNADMYVLFFIFFVIYQVEMMQQQNADVFAIPDYFVYMSRAFATLEGIGLGIKF